MLEHWIPVSYWSQTRGLILHVIQPKEGGGGENVTKRYNCVRGSSELRINIRKPVTLKFEDKNQAMY
jgi:hypothetical protein